MSYDDITLYAEPLTPQQTAAVKHLLAHSALAVCAGTTGRVTLHDHRLTVTGLDTWSWSSGEAVLLGVLLRIAGHVPMPTDLWRLDDRERRVVGEALMLAIPAEERAGLERLLARIEGSDVAAAGGAS